MAATTARWYVCESCVMYSFLSLLKVDQTDGR